MQKQAIAKWPLVLAALFITAPAISGCGDDSGTACPQGQQRCGEQCVDLDTDQNHCGTCDNACGDGMVCNGAGQCALPCENGLTDCGGTCVDTDTDQNHCGACDNACDPGYLCDGGGQCVIDCATGLTDCSGTCVDLTLDDLHCGACDHGCDAGFLCAGSTCEMGCDGAPCQEGDTWWQLRAGDAGSEWIQNLAVAPNDDIVIYGRFEAELSWGATPLVSAGENDLFLSRLDAYGNLVWNQRFGDSTSQYTDDMVVDSGGNIIFSGSSGANSSVDIGGTVITHTDSFSFVAKLDPAGNHLWSMRLPDDVDARDLAVDVNDAIIVSGVYQPGTVTDLGGGALTACVAPSTYCPYLLKLDASGTHVWSRGDNVQASCFHQAMATDGQDIVIAGGCNDDSTYDNGCGSHTCTGEQCQYAVRLDANGVCVWNNHYAITGSGGFQLEGIHVNSTGDLTWHCWMNGTADHGGGSFAYTDHNFVVTLDASGVFVDEQRYLASTDLRFWRGFIDGDDNLFLSGSFEGTLTVDGSDFTSVGDRDGILLKFDPAGNLLRGASFGGSGYDYMESIGMTSDGVLVVSGGFGDTINPGLGDLTALGSDDIWMAGLIW